VPIRPLVLAPQTKKLPARIQNSFERLAIAECADCRGEWVLHYRRGDRHPCGWPSGSKPLSCGRSRIRSRARGAISSASIAISDDRRTPAVVDNQLGEEWQEYELAGGGTGSEHAESHAAMRIEPALHDSPRPGRWR